MSKFRGKIRYFCGFRDYKNRESNGNHDIWVKQPQKPVNGFKNKLNKEILIFPVNSVSAVSG